MSNTDGECSDAPAAVELDEVKTPSGLDRCACSSNVASCDDCWEVGAGLIFKLTMIKPVTVAAQSSTPQAMMPRTAGDSRIPILLHQLSVGSFITRRRLLRLLVFCVSPSPRSSSSYTFPSARGTDDFAILGDRTLRPSARVGIVCVCCVFFRRDGRALNARAEATSR